MQEPNSKLKIRLDLSDEGQRLIDVPPPGVYRTRAEFTAAMLAEALAFRAENESDREPGEDPDDVLQAFIDEIREAQSSENLVWAWALAVELHAYLTLVGYADASELPRWLPR